MKLITDEDLDQALAFWFGQDPWHLGMSGDVANDCRRNMHRIMESVIAPLIVERCAQVADEFTNGAHIAYDMREGNFPARSQPGVAVAATIRALVKEGEE